ncbi:MAG TPA: ABC transporter permease [Desulfatiglandales bacterium]|nr:ABC transporter permease [Desulfatiglandales bacterium]
MIIKNITSKNKELIRDITLGIQNLLLHKLRSFLTMLGVVFGVGSVVAMLSVGEGASKAALDNIKKVGSNNLIITSMKSVEEENISNRSESFMSVYGLKYTDYERLKATFSTIKTAVPVKLINKSGTLGQRTMDLRVVGTTPEWFKLVKRDVVAGRVLVDKDSQERNRSLVLTEYGARRLLAARNTIGQDIKVAGTSFRVVGIVKSSESTAGSSGIQMPDQEVDAYIPIEVARFYFGDISIRETAGSEERKNVELEQIIVEVDDMKHVESTAKGIETMLEVFHKKKDYSISIPLALLRQAEATKRTFNIVLGSIACISLLVGGIGIMNIMLASVTERTREIGIRRAIGAKRKQIITQFLIETVVLSTIGGIVGLFVGIFIPVLITLMAGMKTVITLVSIILPLFISVGIGIFFGLYPAFRAAEVDPIIALRHE